MRNCIFVIFLCEESFTILPSILGLVQPLCPFFGPFLKLILSIFLVLVRMEEKSQKHFDLMAVKHILIHSNPSCALATPPSKCPGALYPGDFFSEKVETKLVPGLSVNLPRTKRLTSEAPAEIR